jgi:hypothetical protein
MIFNKDLELAATARNETSSANIRNIRKIYKYGFIKIKICPLLHTSSQESEADAMAFMLDEIKAMEPHLLLEFAFGEKSEPDESFKKIRKSRGTVRPDCRLYAEITSRIKDSANFLQRCIESIEEVQSAAAIDVWEGSIHERHTKGCCADKQDILHPFSFQQLLRARQHRLRQVEPDDTSTAVTRKRTGKYTGTACKVESPLAAPALPKLQHRLNLLLK